MKRLSRLFIALALVATIVGCASKSVRDVAAEEGVEVTIELQYFGALKDYNSLKADAAAYAALPSTPADHVERIVNVVNGGTSDAGCTPASIEPRCLDGADGAIRAFEQVRRIGGATPGGYSTVSFALATAAAQIRATTGSE
jgi:hypothetical protein